MRPAAVIIRRKGQTPLCAKPAAVQPNSYLFKPCPPNVVHGNSVPAIIEGCGNVVVGNVGAPIGVKGDNNEVKGNVTVGWPPK